MNQRTRKCKGVNTARDFNGCGEQKYHHRFGLCSSCFASWCLNTPEGQVYMEKQTIKAKKQATNAERNNWRKNRKPKLQEETTNFKARLQTQINKIVRLIDKGLPCLARNNYPGQVHAGHVFSIGSNQTIRFNLHNIHRQGAQSNHYQNDDGLLREGLRNEYGQKYFEFISGLRQSPELNLKQNEYKELAKQAKSIVNHLEAAKDKTYPLSERIHLRNWVNKELGIYANEYCVFPQKQEQ